MWSLRTLSSQICTECCEWVMFFETCKMLLLKYSTVLKGFKWTETTNLLKTAVCHSPIYIFLSLFSHTLPLSPPSLSLCPSKQQYSHHVPVPPPHLCFVHILMHTTSSFRLRPQLGPTLTRLDIQSWTRWDQLFVTLDPESCSISCLMTLAPAVLPSHESYILFVLYVWWPLSSAVSLTIRAAPLVNP